MIGPPARAVPGRPVAQRRNSPSAALAAKARARADRLAAGAKPRNVRLAGRAKARSVHLAEKAKARNVRSAAREKVARSAATTRKRRVESTVTGRSSIARIGRAEIGHLPRVATARLVMVSATPVSASATTVEIAARRVRPGDLRTRSSVISDPGPRVMMVSGKSVNARVATGPPVIVRSATAKRDFPAIAVLARISPAAQTAASRSHGSGARIGQGAISALRERERGASISPGVTGHGTIAAGQNVRGFRDRVRIGRKAIAPFANGRNSIVRANASGLKARPPGRSILAASSGPLTDFPSGRVVTTRTTTRYLQNVLPSAAAAPTASARANSTSARHAPNRSPNPSQRNRANALRRLSRAPGSPRAATPRSGLCRAVSPSTDA